MNNEQQQQQQTTTTKMKKLVLVLAGVLFLLPTNAKAQKSKKKKPNIIFIMSDDHAYQAISAYDDKLLQTPNIDRLAKEGMLFTNASVTNSICAPSRATILTGKHTHINGKVDNYFPFDTTQVTFPKYLKRTDIRQPCSESYILGTTQKG